MAIINADVTIYGQLELGKTNKVILSNASQTANRTFTIPDTAGDIVVDVASQTLTNKTLTSPKINENVVLAATSTTLDDAVAKKHTQNTDTGTTDAGFVINSGSSVKKFTITTGGLAANRSLDAADIVDLSTNQTLTTKTINATNNTISNLTTGMFAAGVIDTDGTLAANSDTVLATQKAIVTYVNHQIGDQSLNGLSDVVIATPTVAQMILFDDSDALWKNVSMSGDAVTTKLGVVTVSKIGGKSISLANSFTTTGNFAVTLAAGATTSLTLPASGTLATLAGVESFTNKTLTSPKINEDVVLASTSTQLDSAVALKHTQNTDTGTTASSFNILSGGTGVKLKVAAGGVLELRNLADNAYADFKAKNATFTGNVTHIDSTDILIADPIITLNSNLADNANNASGGIEIKRLDDETATGRAIESITKLSNVLVVSDAGHGIVASDRIQLVGCTNPLNDGYYAVASIDGASITIDPVFQEFAADQALPAGTVAKAVNAIIEWNEGDKLWEAGYNTLILPIVRRVVIPKTSSTTWTLTHNLGVKEVSVVIYASDDTQVYPDTVTLTSTSVTTVTFHDAQAGYAVVIG